MKAVMDRAALKSISSQLKESGSDIKVLKSNTDEALQQKVNEALHSLPSADVTMQLDSIVPEKLATVLKRDCLGVFIDLSDVSCVRCNHVQACVREYLSNLKGDKLLALKPAMVGEVIEESKKVVKRTSTSSTDLPKKPTKITYEPDRAVFIKFMKNPDSKKSPAYDTFQAILDEVPGTMSELREIVGRDFEQTDEDFIAFLSAIREKGMLKLDIDLTEENKAELRAAGLKI